VYRHALYGAPKLSLWQSLALGTAAVAGGVWLWRRRWRRSGGGTPSAPRRSDRCSLTLLSLEYGISVALLCYAQSFDWTLPWWERFPAVRALQAPYRLLGAAGYGVALATGGALTLWARPSRQAWMGAVVVAGVLAAIALAGRDVPIVADISHTAGTPAAIARERAQPGTTASTDEFLPRTADFQTWHEGEARGFWLYERLFPEASWIAGRLLVWEGDVSVHSLRGGALWTSAGVTAGAGGAVVAVHQLAFPGWRAWVDGRRVAVAPAPEIATQAIRPGFMLVAVPPGRHDVAVRFGADPLHLLATSVTLLTMTTVAWRGLAHTGIARWRPALRRRQGEAQRDPLGRVGALALARGATVIVALLIGGCTLAPLRPSWGPFGFTSAPTNEVVIGVVDAVLAGRTTLRSPSGDTLGPDRFLDVRPLTLWAQDRPLRDAGPRTRRWLFTHAPAEVAVDVLVPRDALFQSALAIDPAAWSAALGDGVRFVVGVTPEGGGETVVLDSVVQPRGRGEQRCWLDVVADLRPWAGQSVRLSLRTDPRQDPSFDWSGWAEPVVVRVDPLTADRLLRSTAELQERVLRP
ncbi:MAG: hypothetical protein M3442_08195, partial [Chloroflexota bacterium]|nr:hypothetical protein [Chloroflexota bacterium]